MSERSVRVVVAKPGLDGHDRGAKIVARALRDAGFEVIYTGLHQTPEQIVATAIQEDADAKALREQGVAEIFGPGASLKAIATWLERELDTREGEA